PPPGANMLSAAAIGEPQALILAQAQSASPVPAFAIAPANPQVGQAVTITNRSRDASGRSLAATLDPGDGSAPASVPANGSVQVVFSNPGAVAVQLSATDTSGASLSVTRPVMVT